MAYDCGLIYLWNLHHKHLDVIVKFLLSASKVCVGKKPVWPLAGLSTLTIHGVIQLQNAGCCTDVKLMFKKNVQRHVAVDGTRTKDGEKGGLVRRFQQGNYS